MKSITSEEFFKQVAINSGADLETVRSVYYGMVRTLSRELKGKQKIKMPDWGEFNIKIHKAKIYKGSNTFAPVLIPAKPLVKFTPDYKVKRYFYELGSEGL